MQLLKNDTRAAVGYLNYPSPVFGLSALSSMGPNTMGERLWPVEISEDGKRVGFSYIAPGEDVE